MRRCNASQPPSLPLLLLTLLAPCGGTALRPLPLSTEAYAVSTCDPHSPPLPRHVSTSFPLRGAPTVRSHCGEKGPLHLQQVPRACIEYRDPFLMDQRPFLVG
jgi:hypothetical protein